MWTEVQEGEWQEEVMGLFQVFWEVMLMTLGEGTGKEESIEGGE